MFHNIISMALILFGFVYLSHGNSVTRIDDIVVKVYGGKILCSTLECPEHSDRCVVIKKNDPKNAKSLVCSQICYAANNKILAQTESRSSIAAGTVIHKKIEVYRDGRSSVSNIQSSGVLYGGVGEYSVSNLQSSAISYGGNLLNLYNTRPFIPIYYY